MKDFLLINFFSKNESSYVKHYIDLLNKKGKTFDCVYFERYSQDTIAQENEILFKEYCPTGGSKLSKIGIMLRYASLIRQLCDPNKYKGIIVLTTVPSIMLYDILTKRFPGRYILDIRDFTHENIRLYYRMVQKLVESSFRTVISSKGFLRFLPKSDKYVLIHNIGREMTEINRTPVLPDTAINIGYVGSVRYYNENISFINQIKNDSRFLLSYYGTLTRGCDLPGYCKTNGIKNVVFYGKYDNDQKEKIYSDIDLIHCAYGNSMTETSSLTPNRLYDAALYKIPMIVSKGTYLSSLIEKYHLGIAVDLDRDDIKECLNSYLSSFSSEEFLVGCRSFLSKVKEDMTYFYEQLSEFVDSVS